MYEWFRQEIAAIKTPKFHKFEMPVAGDIGEGLDPSLPPSYLAFISTFGEAQLYRLSNYYLVGVFYPPRLVTAADSGETYAYFGYSSRFGNAYFRHTDSSPGLETSIFELDRDDPDAILEYAADSFEAWLRSRCVEARETYSARAWQYILDGPVPFTPTEQEIVRARRQYRWQLVGFNETGDTKIQVHNESSITLPYFSLGVRSQSINGAVFLPVAHINPGETDIIERDCYKKLIPPDKLELYDLPDPEPEDRAVYWEFKGSDQLGSTLRYNPLWSGIDKPPS